MGRGKVDKKRGDLTNEPHVSAGSKGLDLETFAGVEGKKIKFSKNRKSPYLTSRGSSLSIAGVALTIKKN
jgi:hypothetical protein